MRWCNEILCQFLFRKRLLTWDSYEAHLTDNVKKALTKSETEAVIVPGGCTKYIQVPDVVWNKPFKRRIEEFYNDWLANGKHKYMDTGNMKSMPSRLVVEWVIKSWQDISNETLAKSMKSCGVVLAIDGTQDDLISCFKEGKKCAAGKALFKKQMLNLNHKNLHENPFEILEEDMAAAAPSFNVIEEDQDDDIELDIM